MDHLYWHDLEQIVSDAVIDDSYADADTPGKQTRYLRELARANAELRGLSAGRNADYGLPRMGEAYALWYHMRRVANLYQILSGFEEDLVRSSPSGQWRILDVGSGTGAGSMAFAVWMFTRGFSLGRHVQTRVLCVEPENPMLEMADFILRRTAERTRCELPLLRMRKDERTLNAAARLPAVEVFEVVLFSTTFDYLDDPAQRESEIASVRTVLDRVIEDGLAFFLVPRVEAKRTLMAEIAAALVSSGGWKRMSRATDVPRTWPDDGDVQTVIRDARTHFHREGERLGLRPPVFPPLREDALGPTYRNDVEAWVFRRESKDALGRKFRWGDARRYMERKSRQGY
jgi:SAM-dependent methyltransferase